MKKPSKKIMIIITIIVIVGVTLGVLLNRSSEAETPLTTNQTATVIRADVTNDISAAGNLSLSVTEDLAFEMASTVEEILVEAGDLVEEGDVLVKLDASAWDTELSSLQRSYLQAEISLKSAQLALSNAERGTATQNANSSDVYYVVDTQAVNLKEIQLEIAEISYENAKDDWEDALASNPEITAPFAGFVSQVLVEGGDEVEKGTIAIQLADPDQFEVEILVSETDIFDVEVGCEALVSIDSEDDLILPGEVTYISPTAEISSGVVNYYVTVEVGSFEDYLNSLQDTTQKAEFNDFELKEGMTVTVSLIISSSTDALVVPNNAVQLRGIQTYVQVVLEDGTTEERTVTTGISDWQYTEITDGLSEGEKVVVLPTTSTTSDEEDFFMGPGGGMMPGGGMPQGGPPSGAMGGGPPG